MLLSHSHEYKVRPSTFVFHTNLIHLVFNSAISLELYFGNSQANLSLSSFFSEVSFSICHLSSLNFFLFQEFFAFLISFNSLEFSSLFLFSATSRSLTNSSRVLTLPSKSSFLFPKSSFFSSKSASCFFNSSILFSLFSLSFSFSCSNCSLVSVSLSSFSLASLVSSSTKPLFFKISLIIIATS